MTKEAGCRSGCRKQHKAAAAGFHSVTTMLLVGITKWSGEQDKSLLLQLYNNHGVQYSTVQCIQRTKRACQTASSPTVQQRILTVLESDFNTPDRHNLSDRSLSGTSVLAAQDANQYATHPGHRSLGNDSVCDIQLRAARAITHRNTVDLPRGLTLAVQSDHSRVSAARPARPGRRNACLFVSGPSVFTRTRARRDGTARRSQRPNLSLPVKLREGGGGS